MTTFTVYFCLLSKRRVSQISADLKFRKPWEAQLPLINVVIAGVCTDLGNTKEVVLA